MLEQLRRIRNPLLRSAAIASFTFSIVTIVSGVAIAIVNPKDKSASRFVVYSSLIGTAGGALYGVIFASKSNSPRNDKWKEWRNFIVFRKVKESEEITSFYLQPQDKSEIPNFEPGQFLTIKLDIPEQGKPIIRTYSLSDYNEPSEYYRLSIKRESAPQGLNVPPGIASNHVHDRIRVGSIIEAKPPTGKFVLNVHNPLPVVLISNGVGITPMISMAKACSLLNPNRPIWFIHGARDGSYHAFRDEIMALSLQNPNLQVHYRYSRPRPEDDGFYHSVGYVDIDLIKQLVAKEAEYFLCGSPAFMDSLMRGLKEGGVSQEKIFFESFSKASKSAPQTNVTSETLANAEIVFARSNQTLTWHKNDGTILEFAEANGIDPPYSCRQGICLTCMCAIEEGEVEYLEPPTGTPDEGSVLICISQPKTPKVVLNL
jgi:uncharacterized protein